MIKMDLTEISPKRVGILTRSYITGLIETALDRRGGEADLGTLLASVKTQALGTRMRPNDGQIAYCLQEMIRQGDIKYNNGSCSLTDKAQDEYLNVGGTSSD